MAEVHRGYDRQLDREVAIKVMHPALGSDVDHQRFASEMRLLAGLNHAGLVTLLDAGLDGAAANGSDAGSPVRVRWLVMELVDGPSLARRLDAGPLTPDEVAVIGSGIAAALAHVHANGIVHRDVKPANILLTSGGQAKLADFGIARAIGDAAGLTGTGHTIGTALYLSPEQVSGGTVSGASDVYALGLVLLEALTGRRAYDGTPVEAAMARLHRRPLIPVSLGSGWVRLLDAMTATDPAERPAAAEAAARLGALGGAGQAGVLAAVAPPATRTAGLPVVPRRRAPWTSYRRFAVTIAAAGALVFLSAGIAEVVGGDGAPQGSAVAGTPTSRAPGDQGKPQGVAPTSAPITDATASSTITPTVAPTKAPAHQSRTTDHHKAKHAKGPGKQKAKKKGKNGKQGKKGKGRRR